MKKDAWWVLGCAGVIVVTCLVIGGCAPSRNVQRSSVRGAGDLAVTVTLDRSTEATAAALVPQIVKACDKIEAALASPGDLTLGGLVHGIKNEMGLPVGVHFLADEIVRAVGADSATKLLSAAQVKYVLALVRGARRGAEGYDGADRGTEE